MTDNYYYFSYLPANVKIVSENVRQDMKKISKDLLFKILTVLLLITTLAVGWGWFKARNAGMRAAFVLFQIQTMHERLDSRGWDSEQSHVEAVWQQLGFFTQYCEHHLSSMTPEPPSGNLRPVYEETVADVLAFLRANSGEDFGSDPKTWVAKYQEGFHVTAVSNKTSQAIGAKTAPQPER